MNCNLMVRMFLWKHDYLPPPNSFSLKGLFICLFTYGVQSLFCTVYKTKYLIFKNYASTY